MNNIKKHRINTILIVVAFLFFLCGFFSIFVYPFNRLRYLPNAIEREQIEQQLPGLKEKWLSQKISDYDIDLRIDNNGSTACEMSGVSLTLHAEVTLMVRDGVISNILKRKEELTVSPPQTLRCQYYAPYTIIGMFDTVKWTLRYKVWPEASLTVEFDPKHGFVSYYEYTCPQCGNVHTTIIYSNFRPVEPDK